MIVFNACDLNILFYGEKFMFDYNNNLKLGENNKDNELLF